MKIVKASHAKNKEVKSTTVAKINTIFYFENESTIFNVIIDFDFIMKEILKVISDNFTNSVEVVLFLGRKTRSVKMNTPLPPLKKGAVTKKKTKT